MLRECVQIGDTLHKGDILQRISTYSEYMRREDMCEVLEQKTITASDSAVTVLNKRTSLKGGWFGCQFFRVLREEDEPI